MRERSRSLASFRRRPESSSGEAHGLPGRAKRDPERIRGNRNTLQLDSGLRRNDDNRLQPSLLPPMTTNIHSDKILILDFGAQYTQLIARRVRELGVYCEIWAWDHEPAEIAAFGAKGIILSGGPESTTLPGAPKAPQEVFDSGLPILGICYGMQTLAAQLGGATEAADQREFGHAEVDIVAKSRLFDGLSDHAGAHKLDVWMSHGDHVSKAPPGFAITGSTSRIPVAVMENEARRWYGVQFHPEVTHTKQGSALLQRFVTGICGCATLWTAANIIEDQIARVRGQVGGDHVLLGLSGGVDSSVVAALLHRAI